MGSIKLLGEAIKFKCGVAKLAGIPILSSFKSGFKLTCGYALDILKYAI